MGGAQMEPFARGDKEAPGEARTDWSACTCNTLAGSRSSRVAVDQQMTDSAGLTETKPPRMRPAKPLSFLLKPFNAAICLLDASSLVSVSSHSSSGSQRSVRLVRRTGRTAVTSLERYNHSFPMYSINRI